MPEAARPQVFTIPGHRSFADALAAGVIARHGRDPLSLGRGRILLPNNRAVRTVTEAFVRASGSGLVLPRLIAIGDPELDDRIGGALDQAGQDGTVAPAIDPTERLFALADLLRRQPGTELTAAEALRLAADLGRTLDQLLIEEIAPAALADAVKDAPELAGHWQVSLDRLRAIIEQWPAELAARGRIDLAERRNRLLHATADRWAGAPPAGFTIAAGITTSAPAVAALLARVARMAGGAVVLPALSLETVMPAAEWDALGPDEQGRGEESHPQFHLKRLLERMGVARGEVGEWRGAGRASSPAVRGRAIANAMTAADFSDKWEQLAPAERRLSGIRFVELPDPAREAQAIAIALREAIETPGRTAALVTPDRVLAARVSALLGRWAIEADDSAGRPLSQTPPGSLLLAILAAAAERLAPVALLALLKHPLAGLSGDRPSWLEAARRLDLLLRGPRPAEGLAGLDRHIAEKTAERRFRDDAPAWDQLRPAVARVAGLFTGPTTLVGLAGALREVAGALAGNAAWSGAAGRAAADFLAALEDCEGGGFRLEPEDALPVFRQLLDAQAVRPPYGGHPRIQVLGLLEARLVQADLMILGGMNEGSWPALPQPDPWLAPRIRRTLGLPGLDFRIGLSAHDFASALGAPRVLLTRARRDSKAPTIASRLWLRLMAMTGGLARDVRLERMAAAIDAPAKVAPARRPRPRPPVEDRPRTIYVTDVDRLKADPFAFYAKAMLKLRALDPVDADHTARWKGTAVHDVLESWLREDDCDPDKLMPRARELLEGETIHPMLRALWQPRLLEAIDWIAGKEREHRLQGRKPAAAEIEGSAELAGVMLRGKADRLDRLAGGGLAIIDYKTGQPPSKKAIAQGMALQLGLLGLIARAGGFPGLAGMPVSHEYWSLARDQKSRGFGYLMAADGGEPEEFLAEAERHFAAAASDWLTGDREFTAKLNPAFAPWGDYDQLMRLEEWYGRE